MFAPMKRRLVGFLGFNGVQALDLVGPADAFASDAFAASGEEQATAGRSPYEVVIIGLQGKRFTASSGLVMQADVTTSTRVQLDTLIVPGGAGLRAPGVGEQAAAWIAGRARQFRRIASVCTGI